MPAILPGEHSAEVLSRYRQDLERLPGVREVRDGSPENEEIRVTVDTYNSVRHYNQLLEDELEGIPVRISAYMWCGKPSPQNEYPTAQEVLQEFGQDLQALPGVLSVGVQRENLGPMLPAFREVLSIHTSRPEDASHLDSLLEDEIRGVPVRIHSAPPPLGW
ncbi:MAG: hypothetical protein HYU64_05945 [Armatimonadetes bacterium]|nr:hypothetical protein [Armatimonadota bacterium]